MSTEVTVHYWGSVRAAAGTGQDVVSAETLADVLAAIKALHAEPRFAAIVDVCGVLIGETPVTSREPADVRMPAGAVVELLPPFAGG